MKSREYWQKRFEEIEKSSNQIGLDTYSQIKPAFLKAQRSIQSEIDSWYARFAANNNVTIQDARRMLSSKELDELKWDVNEFIKYGKENALDKQWMKELENASARFHISKLEALKLRTQQAMEVAFGNELDAVDKMAHKIITEDYYKSIFEIQKGFNIGFDVGQIDERKLNLLVNKPWATDGKNFSSRIWERKRQMVSELHQELTRTLIQGKSPDEAIKHMEKFVQGKVKNARNAAGRLVMTEQAYFHSVSQKEAFNDLDVEEFEIVATLDSHTSEICQEMDGKHFPMDEYSPGVTAPPFHVYCRSVTCPYFNDEFSLGERAARSEDGETYYVPSDMKYPEWKNGFVDGQTDELTSVSSDDTINIAKNVTGNTSGKITRAKDASDFDTLSNYLDSTYGIKTDDSVKKLDFATVKSSIEGVETVIAEYPDVGNLLEKAITSSSGVMSCTGKTLSFNPNNFGDRQQFLNMCKQQSLTGHWIRNSSPESIGVHEAAHGVEQALIEANSSYVYDFQKIIAWNDCSEAKLIVSQACKNIKKTPYGKGKLKKDLIQSISRYALDTDSETMAEAFADVYANGVNANPLSIEIKRLTEEQMKKYKGVI